MYALPSSIMIHWGFFISDFIIRSPVEKAERAKFDQLIQQKLGLPAKAEDFDEELDLEDTPEFEPYEDDDGDALG